MEEEKAAELLRKYTDGTASHHEKILFEALYNKVAESQPVLEEQDYEAIRAEIWQRLPAPPVSKNKTGRWLPYAAVLLLAASVIYIYISWFKPLTTAVEYTKDIPSGSDKAVLTLADGTQVYLNKTGAGHIAQQPGSNIVKSKEAILKYEGSGGVGRDLPAYNQLEVPRGGQYQVVLSDGTRVWLNAQTTLVYPVAFPAGKTREVVLNGEAYFEVAKDARRPFIVKGSKQELKVLGTSFNISSYSGEETVTTLLDGSVLINGRSILKPKEQGRVSNALQAPTIIRVDPTEALSWKEGVFIFNDEPLESIMNKVSRWYNVDVYFETDEMKVKTFGGRISRFDSLSEMLRMLTKAGNVKFRIKDQSVYVVK
ncbi:FecR family protein [Pararcticibacter amylolyticus]|uniref:Anti-sigma factor n=1 Tax=Pararcticibacter amylolyticus TaxID=2173175 RepID=A0A2U2PG09_9SPHI|nr:FecR family protein [Pararcticibacter amylolyticus]PWG80202.1 anti-sigma factor [Pararcticibacter amylolyticus]